MTAKEKYNEDKDELKNARIQRIFEGAYSLFSERGIDTITMTDIADIAQIGVASLYRYFSTKEEVAIQTAIWAWQKQIIDYLPELVNSNYMEKNGIEQVEHIIQMYANLFETKPTFLRFIYFFDSFAVRSNISQSRLNNYENMIIEINNIFYQAVQKGIRDKTIKQAYVNKEKELCFSIMQTMFSLTQKLTLNQNLLHMDSKSNGKEVILLLQKIIIDGIKE